MSKLIIFFVKLFFYYPGKMILWINYFFPSKGKITESRRQFKEGNLIVIFISSLFFWFVSSICIFYASLHYPLFGKFAMNQLSKIDSFITRNSSDKNVITENVNHLTLTKNIKNSTNTNTNTNNYKQETHIFNNENITKLILYAYNFDNDKIYDTINKIKSVEKPVGGDTDTARKLNEEGIVYYKNKDYINASKLFEQASNADPSDLEVLNNYASALELSNQHAETLNVIEKSLLYSIDKTNPWITANNYFVKNNIQNEYSCGSLLLSLRFSKNRKKTIDYYNNLLSNYDEKENIRQNRRMALDCALKRESNY